MKEHRPRNRSLLHWMIGQSLPLETETCVFVLLNAADVFLTYLLLLQKTHFEANPIARYFLYSWGIRGMIYYKFGLVAFVSVIAQIIARRQPSTAKWLLNGGSLVVGSVVIYSLLLLRNSLTGVLPRG